MSNKQWRKPTGAEAIVTPAADVADDEAACCNCRFWHGVAGEILPEVGQCRGAPPSVVLGPQGEVGTAWPIVKRADYCGQFQPRDLQADATATLAEIIQAMTPEQRQEMARALFGEPATGPTPNGGIHLA